MGHPYDVENATRLHVEWCRDLIDRTGLTTTNQTEPLMRAVMFELRRSIAPGAVIAMALPTAIATVIIRPHATSRTVTLSNRLILLGVSSIFFPVPNCPSSPFPHE